MKSVRRAVSAEMTELCINHVPGTPIGIGCGGLFVRAGN